MTGRMDPFGGRGTTGLPSAMTEVDSQAISSPIGSLRLAIRPHLVRQDGGGQDGGQDQPDATGQLSPGPGQQTC